MTYGEAIYQLTNFEGTYETPSLEAIEFAIESLKKVEQLEKENKELNEKLWKKSQTIMQILDRALEFVKEIERLEKENKEMKSILNKFCAEFLCRECPFLDKKNSQCTIYELLL